MAPLFRTCLLAALSGFSLAQYQFMTPDPNVKDRSQSFAVGSTVVVTWKSGWSGFGTDPGYADLFVTSFESDAYVRNLISNRSTADAGSYSWRVNIPAETVNSENGAFVFRWVKAYSPPNFFASNTQVMAPSRGFNVTVAAVSSAVSSSRASSTAASSATAASQTIISASPSAPSATNAGSVQTPAPEKSSTPVGAIAGGVIGGVAVLALIAGLLVLWRRKKAQKVSAMAQQHGEVPYAYPVEQSKQENHYNRPPMQQYPAQGHHYAPQELPGIQMPLEADSHQLPQQQK